MAIKKYAIFGVIILILGIFLTKGYCLYSEDINPEEVIKTKVVQQEKIKQQEIIEQKQKILPKFTRAESKKQEIVPLSIDKPNRYAKYLLLLAISCIVAAIVLYVIIFKVLKNK
ncbi:MAG: hypothetical protein ABH952_10180 [Candidatus Omnitrophota bacterium]